METTMDNYAACKEKLISYIQNLFAEDRSGLRQCQKNIRGLYRFQDRYGKGNSSNPIRFISGR